jgi:hypothetical protein
MTVHLVDRNPFVPTLRTLAIRLCVNNANSFASLGDLPFTLVNPILLACTATQLTLLEDQSPHLRPDTQEIWARHVSERFIRHCEKEEGEDWRDVYERLKMDESERLKIATARLRAKNGRIKEEKLAKQIVVIDPKKAPVTGHLKRANPFGSNIPNGAKLMVVNGVSPKKKNSLMQKAKRDTSIAKLNYAAAPRFSVSRPTGLTRPGGFNSVPNVPKVRREPVPANDKNVFGKPLESSKVSPDFIQF